MDSFGNKTVTHMFDLNGEALAGMMLALFVLAAIGIGGYAAVREIRACRDVVRQMPSDGVVDIRCDVGAASSIEIVDGRRVAVCRCGGKP